MTIGMALLQLVAAVIAGLLFGWHAGRQIADQIRTKTWLSAKHYLSVHYADQFASGILGLLLLSFILVLTPYRWYSLLCIVFMALHCWGYVWGGLHLYSSTNQYTDPADDEDPGHSDSPD